MIIILKQEAPEQKVRALIEEVQGLGMSVNYSAGAEATILGLIGDTSRVDEDKLRANEVVADVRRITEPYKKANRRFHPLDTHVAVAGRTIGEGFFHVMAGPCSVESEAQLCTVAESVKKSGATFLRGGAFKPRTSPYSFQGLEESGLDLLREARRLTGLPIVTEIMGEEQIPEFEDVDILQVGARNMQNFRLLKALGRTKKPVLLKRGLSATIEEWLMSAEYIMAGGNENVILCERGIRTFEKYTRNTLDLSVIPIVKEKTHLPIVIDPSHATGDWRLVESMSLAAVAAGADGLIIEVHPCPERAWSDGAQSLTPEHYASLVKKARRIAAVIDREL